MHHYASLQCHMILQKSFKYTDLLSVLKQLCCLIFFGMCDTIFHDSFMNKKLKGQHLFKIEIFCNNIHYCLKVWGQFVFKKLLLLFSKDGLNW